MAKTIKHKAVKQLFEPVGELKAVAIIVAQSAHKMLMLNDSEPLDGDDTERLAGFFLEELNRLNANVVGCLKCGDHVYRQNYCFMHWQDTPEGELFMNSEANV